MNCKEVFYNDLVYDFSYYSGNSYSNYYLRGRNRWHIGNSIIRGHYRLHCDNRVDLEKDPRQAFKILG